MVSPVYPVDAQSTHASPGHNAKIGGLQFSFASNISRSGKGNPLSLIVTSFSVVCTFVTSSI